MKKISYFLTLCFFIISCSGSGYKRRSDRDYFDKSNLEKVQTSEKRISDFYSSSGSGKYLLPNLPKWANFSQSAGCQRREDIQYINTFQLTGNYNLEYKDALLVQYEFNINKKKELREKKVLSLSPRDEEVLFQRAIDAVVSGRSSFKVPDFNRVHFIWIDPFIGTSKISKLKRFMDSDTLGLGHPVFVSLCLTYWEMEQFLKENKWQNFRVALVSAELFNPFAQGEMEPSYFQINFNNFFKKDQKLYFYSSEKFIPRDFKGSFKYKKIY